MCAQPNYVDPPPNWTHPDIIRNLCDAEVDDHLVQLDSAWNHAQPLLNDKEQQVYLERVEQVREFIKGPYLCWLIAFYVFGESPTPPKYLDCTDETIVRKVCRLM